jgi:REP element-mobilizing transposase RayT
MNYDPEKGRRRSIRLKGYDYSGAGAYFVTLCTRNCESLFGEIVKGEMVPSELGQIVLRYCEKLAVRYSHAELDAFVLMPNHVHGIIVMADVRQIHDARAVGAIHELPLPNRRLHRRRMLIPRIVGWFKMNTARRINEQRHTPGLPVWQRNYFEHIIRNEDGLNLIREYIFNNPLRWHLDRENPRREAEDDFDGWLASLYRSPAGATHASPLRLNKRTAEMTKSI